MDAVTRNHPGGGGRSTHDDGASRALTIENFSPVKFIWVAIEKHVDALARSVVGRITALLCR